MLKLLCIYSLHSHYTLLSVKLNNMYNIKASEPTNALRIGILAKYSEKQQFEAAPANSENSWDGVFITF